jgi:hypothetical protein
MTDLTHDQRCALLRALSRLSSDADDISDDHLLKTFLPLPQHIPILEQKRWVVRGERGTGKTHITRTIEALNKRGIPISDMFIGLERPEQTIWIDAFIQDDVRLEFPTELGDITELKKKARRFWLAWLGFSIVRWTHQNFPTAAEGLPEIKVTINWLEMDEQEGASHWRAMSIYQDMFAKLDRTVVLVFDFLDRLRLEHKNVAINALNWELGVREVFIAQLLNLWLDMPEHKFPNIRPKIFLREDLYQRCLGFTDSSKLESRSVRLEWEGDALFRLLMRHMAYDDGLRAWMEGHGVRFTEDERFGYMPPATLPEKGAGLSQDAFIAALAGPFMGATASKGLSYRWIVNHLQDSNKRRAPRAVLDLIMGAAQHALDKGPRGEGPHILHHTELVEGLKYASGKRAKEVAEEHPVVHRLESLRGFNMPMPSVEASARLSSPSHVEDGFGKDGDAVIRALIEIGLMRPYLDKKIDVPDLYRYGYGITRKGGARAPLP